MYDPQTIQLIMIVISLGLSVTFIVALFWGLFLLSRIRKQTVGINKRLDQLMALISSGPANTGGAGMSL